MTNFEYSSHMHINTIASLDLKKANTLKAILVVQQK